MYAGTLINPIRYGKINEEEKYAMQFLDKVTPMIPLRTLAALFIIYSIGGWIYETAYSSIRRRRFCNRGFGIGPWCPIYGIGGTIATALIPNTLPLHLQFIESAFIMTALEYMSSVSMERMFGARWWDYTDKPLNIDGRVCLYGFLAFGFMCTVVVSFLSPSLTLLIDALPRDIVSAASSCIISLMAIDLLKSATALTNLSGKMSDAAIAETMERIGETTDDRETMDENVEELEKRLEARKRSRLSTVPPELYEYISSMGDAARRNAQKATEAIDSATETLKQATAATGEQARMTIAEAAERMKAIKEDRRAEVEARKAEREEKHERRMQSIIGKLNIRERRIVREFPKIHMTEAGSESVLDELRKRIGNGRKEK